MLSCSILICTFNRARLLQETLESLCQLRTVRHWEVVVVDNNSTDETRQVVERFQGRMPAPLLYLFEQRQGKSFALNTGLAQSRGEIILFTDDDVRVSSDWLDAATAPLECDPGISYTGGPVRPIWGGPPPGWLDQTRGELWGTLAILDYGFEPFVFEERQRIPLGVNMAVRRGLIEQVGGFHTGLGRRGGSLLGQEQAEFFARARRAGATGRYEPRMELHHHVPAMRLTKAYFRRWWFWKGVARAQVDAMHGETELGLKLAHVPRVLRVPRFVWGALPRRALDWAGAVIAGDERAAARHEMALAYSCGYVRARWGRTALVPLDPIEREQEPISVSR